MLINKMSTIFPRNNLSNIQYNMIIYYLSTDEEYKSYIKTLRMGMKKRRGDTRRVYARRGDDESEISVANAMNSLVVDSIIYKRIKII
jgi:hypothetical protein